MITSLGLEVTLRQTGKTLGQLDGFTSPFQQPQFRDRFICSLTAKKMRFSEVEGEKRRVGRQYSGCPWQGSVGGCHLVAVGTGPWR